MPVKHRKDGYYWGSKGPYKTKKKAEEVGRAAYASGYEGSMSMGGGKRRGRGRHVADVPDELAKRGKYDELEERLNDLAKRIVRLKGIYRKKYMTKGSAY